MSRQQTKGNSPQPDHSIRTDENSPQVSANAGALKCSVCEKTFSAATELREHERDCKMQQGRQF